jgi:hypothetical protein
MTAGASFDLCFQYSEAHGVKWQISAKSFRLGFKLKHAVAVSVKVMQRRL